MSLMLWCMPLSSTIHAEDSSLESRLNKILYWRISDELELKPQVEKKLISVLEDSRVKRQEALEKRMAAFAQMQKCEEAREKSGENKVAHDKEHPEHQLDVDKALDDYLQSGKTLQQVDIDEYQQIIALLGKEKTLRFFVIRKNMADELKSALKK